jgi:rhodanese-related sulfurtransferase
MNRQVIYLQCLSELEQGWPTLPPDRELVIVCQNGEKSLLASQFLKQKGYLNVSSMRGGLLLWMQKGYPVVGKRFALAGAT